MEIKYYQTIPELGIFGRMNTPEEFEKIGLPKSLDGSSVLDIGCNSGAFMIECHKRGANDKWKKNWIRINGDSVYNSPEYFYYLRKWDKIKDWKMLNNVIRCKRMDLVLESIREWGQIKPIVVNGKHIVTGHKRAAAMAFLGYKFIEVE